MLTTQNYLKKTLPALKDGQRNVYRGATFIHNRPTSGSVPRALEIASAWSSVVFHAC